ncbi:MAG TPA: cysteine--tRNA ligase [Patescibacteria group bacterium]|nr:cysteine--tRNA ligase [Patescibacteria group bacterium]
MLSLYNTLHHQKENFIPCKKRGGLFGGRPRIGIYTCGPTVYNYAHLGNLRAYVVSDLLKRVLIDNGYRLRHIMNITDVGHLTSDADEGEDKLEKGARREGKTAWEVADFYIRAFKNDLRLLNIQPPDKYCRATDHIREQIKLVKQLIAKGVTYTTNDGIYFDTTKIHHYGQLANLENQELKAGARVGLGEKKNPHDFALWKFSPATAKRQMEWKAFGHLGFPGWHLECSAMAMKYLGEQFDIHCGGIDHIPVHHTNEIAQSETATGKKPWVKYWLHNEFLVTDKEKMAKSGDNFLTLAYLQKQGINPLAYRYFLLQTHYRKQQHFSLEAVKAAQAGWERMTALAAQLRQNKNPANREKIRAFQEQFHTHINDDLDIPQALALTWEYLNNHDLDFATLKKADRIFGLNLGQSKVGPTKLDNEIRKLIKQRQEARQKKNWTESDHLRQELENKGYRVEDTPDGQIVEKK